MEKMGERQFNASLDALVDGGNVSPAAVAKTNPGPEVRQSITASSCQGLTQAGGEAQLSNQHSSLMSLPMPPSMNSTTGASMPLDLAGMMATANASSSQITANLFAPAGSGNGIMATPGVPVTTAMPSYPYAPIAAPIAPMSSSNMMKMMRPPSVASSDQGSVRGCSKKARSKRNRCASEVSENEDEGTGRKLNRNKREQQRSQQITSQITNLKKVLVDANVQFKPDKYSTLVSVVDYVKQLQQRSKILDSEHSKLLDTINKTSEIVNSQQLAPSVTSALSDSCTGLSNDLLSDGTISPLCEDEAMVMVRGLDYKAVFGSCPLAFSIASVDGRFLDCNREFEKVTGYTRKQLLTDRTTTGPEQGSDSDITASDSESGGVSPSQKNGKNKSLFNILNHDDAGIRGVFTAMSEMLRRPVLDGSSSADIVSSEDCWTEEVGMGRLEKKIRLTLSLVRTPQGRPRFFNVTLIPVQ